MDDVEDTPFYLCQWIMSYIKVHEFKPVWHCYGLLCLLWQGAQRMQLAYLHFSCRKAGGLRLLWLEIVQSDHSPRGKWNVCWVAFLSALTKDWNPAWITKRLPKRWERNEWMLGMTHACPLQYTCGLPELTSLELLCLGQETDPPSSLQHVYKLPVTSVHSVGQDKTQHPFHSTF